MNEIDLGRLDLNLLITFESLMETRSVTQTAERLNRTQSAISHALGRLREQLGDPILVRVGGRMQPSPFAEALIEDVRPILQGLRRALTPANTFDPATSTRVFRIAIPTLTRLIAEVSTEVARAAPGARIEWLPAHHHVYAELSEGLIDLAHLGGEPRLPDGLEEHVTRPFSWVTFMRKDHPALATWGPEAWRRYPHLAVNVTRSAPNPFRDTGRPDGARRTIQTLIADSAGVAPILARSDFLATFPALLLAWDMEVHNLVARKPPVPLDPVLVRFFWSSRLANDPGAAWIRRIVISAYERLNDEAERKLATVVQAA